MRAGWARTAPDVSAAELVGAMPPGMSQDIMSFVNMLDKASVQIEVLHNWLRNLTGADGEPKYRESDVPDVDDILAIVDAVYKGAGLVAPRKVKSASFKTMLRPELVAACAARGLSTAGTKADLLLSINQYEAARPVAAASAGAAAGAAAPDEEMDGAAAAAADPSDEPPAAAAVPVFVPALAQVAPAAVAAAAAAAGPVAAAAPAAAALPVGLTGCVR